MEWELVEETEVQGENLFLLTYGAQPFVRSCQFCSHSGKKTCSSVTLSQISHNLTWARILTDVVWSRRLTDFSFEEEVPGSNLSPNAGCIESECGCLVFPGKFRNIDYLKFHRLFPQPPQFITDDIKRRRQLRSSRQKKKHVLYGSSGNRNYIWSTEDLCSGHRYRLDTRIGEVDSRNRRNSKQINSKSNHLITISNSMLSFSPSSLLLFTLI
jgi:hypothetical protein